MEMKKIFNSIEKYFLRTNLHIQVFSIKKSRNKIKIEHSIYYYTFDLSTDNKIIIDITYCYCGQEINRLLTITDIDQLNLFFLGYILQERNATIIPFKIAYYSNLLS